MSDINKKCEQIVEIATKYSGFDNKQEDILTKNIVFDKFTLDSVLKQYQNASPTQPVNYFRSLLATNLLTNPILNRELYEKVSNEVISKSRPEALLLFRPFAMLYPFFKHQYERDFNVRKELELIASETIKRLNLGEFVKYKCTDFLGSRMTGSDRVWLAIYNNTHPNQTTAFQFFINFSNAGIECWVYKHLTNEIRSQLRLDLKKDILDQIQVFFNESIQIIIKDVFNPDKVKKEYIIIGCKGRKIHKLSHSPQYFSTKEIQYCIQNDLAVISDQTKALAGVAKTQYQLFQEAKKGDFVYITYGNNQLLIIGIFIDENEFSHPNKKLEWRARRYRLIAEVRLIESYKNEKKRWAPNQNSTFVPIPDLELSQANQQLFEPFFGVQFDAEREYISEYNEKENLTYASNFKISLNYRDITPELDVKEIAKEFSGLIQHLYENVEGQFLGLFGRWGRGKTFFMKYVKKTLCINPELKPYPKIWRYFPIHIRKIFHLFRSPNHQSAKDPEEEAGENKVDLKTDQKPEDKFLFIEFNTWKHQDAEAVWAFIYKSMIDEYLKLGRENIFLVALLKFRLNRTRKKNRTLIKLFYFLFFTGIFSLIWYWIPVSWRQLDLIKLTGTLAGSFLLIKNGQELWDFVKGNLNILYDQFKSTPDYSVHLGLHIEIQDEIQYLFKAWFSLNTKLWEIKYNRILLFVDDIDRCHEEKIIQLVDSIRVLFDDSKINHHLAVVAALDEGILKRAILWKYRDMMEVERKYDGNDLDIKNITNVRITEYFDKLFIAGIKLPKLAKNDIDTILSRFAYTMGVRETNSPIPNEINDIEGNPIIEVPEMDSSETGIFDSSPKNSNTYHESEFFLMDDELNLLKKELHLAVKDLNKEKFDYEITPRQLRIYLNRYLLAKNFAGQYWLKYIKLSAIPKSYYEYLIKHIVKKMLGGNYKIEIPNDSEDWENTVLKDYTEKIIEMVVPYYIQLNDVADKSKSLSEI